MSGHYSQAFIRDKYVVIGKRKRGPDGLLDSESAHQFADDQVDSGAWPRVDRLEHDARYWIFLALKENLP